MNLRIASSKLSLAWWHRLLLPALKRKRQGHFCESESSLVYRSEIQDSQGYVEALPQQNQNKQKKSKFTCGVMKRCLELEHLF